MAEAADTAYDALGDFDGSESLDAITFATLDFSAREIGVGASKRALEGGGGPGGGFLHQATVELSDAQIKALPSTFPGVLLVAAPDSGQAIVPLQYVLHADLAAGYTLDTDATLVTHQGIEDTAYILINEAPANGVDLLLQNSGECFVVSTPSQHYYSTIGYTAGFIAMTPEQTSGASLRMYGINGDGDFTGGDAGNVLRVTTAYFLLDLTTGEFV